jgi:hypothetical protein
MAYSGYSFTLLLSNDTVGSSEHIAAHNKIIDELGKVWKKAVVASFKVLSRHLARETEENH